MYKNELRSNYIINIYTFILERSACSVPHTCALSALELFFCDFSATRPRFVARLARNDSPQSLGTCPRADPPSLRPSRSASEVSRSCLRGLPHAPQYAPQSQPCFVTTISLLGSSYSPAVTLIFFVSFSFSTVMTTASQRASIVATRVARVVLLHYSAVCRCLLPGLFCFVYY